MVTFNDYIKAKEIILDLERLNDKLNNSSLFYTTEELKVIFNYHIVEKLKAINIPNVKFFICENDGRFFND
jgi:hypothetical protein